MSEVPLQALAQSHARPFEGYPDLILGAFTFLSTLARIAHVSGKIFKKLTFIEARRTLCGDTRLEARVVHLGRSTCRHAISGQGISQLASKSGQGISQLASKSGQEISQLALLASPQTLK